ncbi:MAG TPA: type II toxin-antitoxin system VapC family toxin [Alloacidobacterium sp.]|nr:type II toxin-antitoxin system VapC family toxin [Alloacidobacterium sp.]
MPFVLDASTTACWAFQDEQHPDADAALERMRTDQAIAPSLWWFEIRNILIVNERRKRLSEADTAAFLRDLAVFSVEIDITPETDEVLRLARTHKLSIYDAAYLELALRKNVPLATLDADLSKAARMESVLLVGAN